MLALESPRLRLTTTRSRAGFGSTSTRVVDLLADYRRRDFLCPGSAGVGRSATRATPTLRGLRRVDAVEVDYLLRDLNRDVRLHVRVEPGVVLLLRLPHLGHDEAAGVFIRDMEQETGLLLDQLDQRRGHLVVLRGTHCSAVSNQDSH